MNERSFRMLLQSKHLHASGGMHIGDPVLQFRAHARQNLLLYPEYLAVISSFQKHWSASLCVNTVPSPTVPSCEAGHPTTVHSVPPAVVPSCEVSKSSHGQQCAHHQHSMSALLTKDSEGQGRPGGRILWEEASFPEAGRDGLQLLTSGSSQPVGAATALSSELGALAVLRTPGTLLPVKLPLPECPFKDVALQLRDIQDAVERGRLSGQQFRLTLNECRESWLDNLVPKDGAKAHSPSKELVPEAECWFLLCEAAQAAQGDAGSVDEVEACRRAHKLATQLRDGHTYAVAAPMLQGHLLHNAGLWKLAASCFSEARDTAAEMCQRLPTNAGGSELGILEAWSCNNLGCCLQAQHCNGLAAAQFYSAKKTLLAASGPDDRATQVALLNWKNVLAMGRPRDRLCTAGALQVQKKGRDALASFLRSAVPRGPVSKGPTVGIEALNERIKYKDVHLSADGKKGKKNSDRSKKGKEKGSEKAGKFKSKVAHSLVHSGATLALVHYGIVNNGLPSGKKGKK